MPFLKRNKYKLQKINKTIQVKKKCCYSDFKHSSSWWGKNRMDRSANRYHTNRMIQMVRAAFFALAICSKHLIVYAIVVSVLSFDTMLPMYIHMHVFMCTCCVLFARVSVCVCLCSTTELAHTYWLGTHIQNGTKQTRQCTEQQTTIACACAFVMFYLLILQSLYHFLTHTHTFSTSSICLIRVVCVRNRIQ